MAVIRLKVLFTLYNKPKFENRPLPEHFVTAIWAPEMDSGYDVKFEQARGQVIFPGETQEVAITIYTSDSTRLTQNLQSASIYQFGIMENVIGEGTLISLND